MAYEIPDSPNKEIAAAAEQKLAFQGVTRDLKIEDLVALQPILETWIKDRKTKEPLPKEVQGVLDAMRASIEGGNDVHYVVAEEEGVPVGVVGFKPLVDERMKALATTDNPAELINAYVKMTERAGRGVGKSLLGGLEKTARARGFTEVILNSGPRYKDTAWGFYTKMYGEPVGTIPEMYGPGGDAPVWRKELVEKGDLL